MTADQILIAVIGLFFTTTGVMYIIHLRQKKEKVKREWMVSYALILVGMVVLIIPFLSSISITSDHAPIESKLLGQDAFGPALPSASGSYDEASKVYQKGASLWSYENNGYDSVETAMAYFNKSIKLYETAEALSARGQLKVQLGKMTEAIVDYNRSIELKPEYGNPYFNRAAVFYIMGDISRACLDWKKAAELEVPGAKDLVMSMCN